MLSFAAPEDWESPEDEVAEDLAALGMTVKASDDIDEDEEDVAIIPPGTVIPDVVEEEDEPLDGLARLEKLEKELLSEQGPEISVDEAD